MFKYMQNRRQNLVMCGYVWCIFFKIHIIVWNFFKGYVHGHTTQFVDPEAKD